MRDLINQMKTSKDPNYCHRVTANDGALGEQHLRDFQDNEKTIPTILTTSQKLSTGVDARNIRNIVLMRPINSMIEFKQIIGRGTRLYDGKDYFTIYDFVKAHHHFSDPEWDGEPIEPEPCPSATACECDAACPSVESRNLRAEGPARCGKRPCVCKKKMKVKLADGKERTIQHMMATTLLAPGWHADVGAAVHGDALRKLPEFFKDEAELRAIWSEPDTREKLLQGLAEKGFGKDQLAEMQKIIDAEKSDLFDVLAHVAYALPPLTREERAAKAKAMIGTHFTSKQQVFPRFVLSQYVKVGVDELNRKLSPLLKLKYNNAIADAIADLGKPGGDWKAFAGFQQYLYADGGGVFGRNRGLATGRDRYDGGAPGAGVERCSLPRTGGAGSSPVRTVAASRSTSPTRSQKPSCCGSTPARLGSSSCRPWRCASICGAGALSATGRGLTLLD